MPAGAFSVLLSFTWCSLLTAAPLSVDLDDPFAAPFYGHGLVSAEASKFLADYPEDAQEAIFDLLFKPRFGASAQALKIEIGGDGDGEAAHQHVRGDINCQRGVQWGIAKAAKQRNPHIRLLALAWAAPGWVGNGNWFSDDNVQFVLTWLSCARFAHGLEIDVLGIRNEVGYDSSTWVPYVLALRNSLNNGGFASIRLILHDGPGNAQTPGGHLPPDLMNDLRGRSDFRNAVDFLGLHYPCMDQDPNRELSALQKPLWASEDFSNDANGWSGASMLGWRLNRNYIYQNVSSLLAWSPVWSLPADLWGGGGGCGFIRATEPWSGHYEVNPVLWTMAHHTQFTEGHGWSILRDGAGSGWLPQGGSYVTYVSSDHGDFSIVLETANYPLKNNWFKCYPGQTAKVQHVQFQVSGSLHNFRHLRGGALQAWKSNASHQFLQVGSVFVDSVGIFSVTIEPDTILTLTSLVGQNKAASAPVAPAAAPFPYPYFDSFDDSSLNSAWRYAYFGSGAWEIVQGEASHGNVLQQLVRQPNGANGWGGSGWNRPVAVLGDTSWKDYTLSLDGQLPASSGFFGLCVRVQANAYTDSDKWPLQGYCLNISTGGVCALLAVNTVLATCKLPMQLLLPEWNRFGLEVIGTKVVATLGGLQLLAIDLPTEPAFTAGRIALFTGFHDARFDNIAVQPSTTDVHIV